MNYLLVILLITYALFNNYSFAQTQRMMQQQAQIVVAEGNDDLLIYKRMFTDEEINHLLRTKTVFLYPDTILPSLEAFKQAVTTAWTLTPVSFDSYRNESKYLTDTGVSLFKIGAGGFRIFTNDKSSIAASAAPLSLVHCYFTLQTTRSYMDAKGQNRMVANAFCRIELFPDEATSDMTDWMRQPELINAINQKGFFHNLTPVLLAAHLQTVANNITNKIRPYLYADTLAPRLSTLLSTDTLYVPQSVLIHMRPLGGKQSLIKDNLFRKYPFPYKICSNAELFTIFNLEKRGRLLFEYVKSVADKFVSVIDVKEGAIIYKKYTSGSYNLKEKDIEEIAKALENHK